jgi:hypothetical protein
VQQSEAARLRLRKTVRHRITCHENRRDLFIKFGLQPSNDIDPVLVVTQPVIADNEIGAIGIMLSRLGSEFHPLAVRGRLARNTHDIAFRQRIRRAVDYVIGQRETIQDFDPGAEIAAERDRLQLDFVVRAEHEAWRTLFGRQGALAERKPARFLSHAFRHAD